MPEQRILTLEEIAAKMRRQLEDLNAEEAQAILRADLEKERQEELTRYAPKKEEVGDCLCGGKIVLEKTWANEFDPSMGPLIIGPGSKNQFNWVPKRECYCSQCGLLYSYGVLLKKAGK